jgi:alpha-galactosidase
MLPPQRTLDSLPRSGDSQIISASGLRIDLPQPAENYYRHGWHSWSLTSWLDPGAPPAPARAAEFRMKDEDPVYALSRNHIGAWVGAVDFGDDDILLVGALGLGGRVELDRLTLKCFYETAGRREAMSEEWLIARGREDEVFFHYAKQLQARFGSGRFEQAPRVWCSWYSLYTWIHEDIILRALQDFGDMPFDVFQLDDGWQVGYGDWQANRNFPSGMKALAGKISTTGRTPGIWLAPFMVSPRSQLARAHPDWLLRDETGAPVRAGMTWNGKPFGLDVTHPAVLEWLHELIREVRGWGYGYLKLDFLYIAALPGARKQDMPREVAYRNAMQMIREAAEDAYILACGAPVIPSLGLCDGLRVGPDVAPYWINKPLSVWLNNPNDGSSQNAIRTSLHRLWLRPLVNIDPDVSFFRTKHSALQPHEQQLLQDLGIISGFKATSDLPQWLSAGETAKLRHYLESIAEVEKTGRYEYQIDSRRIDFSRAVPILASTSKMPVWLAKNLGLLKIAWHQALPAIRESRRR